MNIKSNKSVLLAMSGGVDSSVALKILKDKGYNVVGVHMLFWNEKDTNENYIQNKADNAMIAANIAERYNSPFYTIDLKKEFKKLIVDDFLSNYEKCVTPNPCVVCNKKIKFEYLVKLADKYNCEYIATGHYAKIEEKNGDYYLKKAIDQNKDQTYFLYKLDNHLLKRIIFPMGDYIKEDVKKCAFDSNMKNISEKKESQGVCFYEGKKLRPFLEKYLPKSAMRPGNIVDKMGNIVGKHEGLPFYTIGQRKGIKVGGEKDPWIVLSMDVKNNELIVGKEPDLYSNVVKINKVIFTNKELKIGDNVEVVLRYRSLPVRAQICDIKDGIWKLDLHDKVRAVSAGQSAVFYEGDLVLGGGLIC